MFCCFSYCSFSVSHPITLERASQVAEKRDPCQGAAGVTLPIRSRKGCKFKIINFKENDMNEFCINTNADQIIATALKCLEEQFMYAKGETFSSSHSVRNYLRLQLAPESREVFASMFMDNHHRLLSFEKLFNGTINEAVVYPRCIVQKAIQYNAAAIIVAHNHPSGVAKPSAADKRVTADLKQILEIINVKLLDHVVVTVSETYSFAEHGLL